MDLLRQRAIVLRRDQYARQLRVIYHGVIMRTRCVNETYRVSRTIRGLDRTSERMVDRKLQRESNCTIIVSRNCRRRAIVYYLNATCVIERRDKTPKTDIAAERIAANRKSYAALVRVTIASI